METDLITKIPTPTSKPEPPARVRDAVTILAVLAFYGIAMGLIVCLAGLFVGTMLLVPGFVHTGFGIAFLVCRTSIVRRRRWARGLGLMLAGCLVMLPPLAVATGGWQMLRQPTFLIFPLVLAAGGVALGWTLSTRSARDWCSR